MKTFVQMALGRSIASLAILFFISGMAISLKAQDLVSPQQANDILSVEVERLNGRSVDLFQSGETVAAMQVAYRIHYAQSIIQHLQNGAAVREAIRLALPSSLLQFSNAGDGQGNVMSDLEEIQVDLKSWALELLAR